MGVPAHEETKKSDSCKMSSAFCIVNGEMKPPEPGVCGEAF